jgi:hypothetical protein
MQSNDEEAMQLLLDYGDKTFYPCMHRHHSPNPAASSFLSEALLSLVLLYHLEFHSGIGLFFVFGKAPPIRDSAEFSTSGAESLLVECTYPETQFQEYQEWLLGSTTDRRVAADGQWS